MSDSNNIPLGSGGEAGFRPADAKWTADARDRKGRFSKASSASQTPKAPESPEALGEQARARLAHELSNLLDGSLRNVSLALLKLDDAGLEATVGQSAQRLRTASDSMHQMAMLLKRWMRTGIPVEAAELYWQDAKLGEAMGYARRNVEPIADTRNIVIDVDLPAEVAALPAGPLYPVLANGLLNAVEAIEHDGRVTVRGRREGDRVVLEIADDGPGVSEALPRDGEGMVRGGATTKANGHGMGLAVSREIVASVGGVIRLENGPSGGAVLIVKLKVES